MKKILVTGGGTAGHVYPALAVIEALKNKTDTQILFVGGRGGPEEEMVTKANLAFRPISVGKLRRYVDFRNLVDPFKAMAGYFEAMTTLVNFRPDAIFAKGGYVTVPVILAGKSRGIPIVTHESDLVMGVSNRLGNRLAAKICVGFPTELYPGINRHKLVYTGNPLRSDFPRAKGRRFHALFGLSPSLPTVLAIGGSQGAQSLNDLVAGLAKDVTFRAQLLHMTGEFDFERINRQKEALPPAKSSRYVVRPFIEEIAQAMATADIIITRAGANALFEIAFMGKSAIVIPLPSAANDHQRKNAAFFAKEQAAVVLDQDKTNSQQLYQAVYALLTDKVGRDKLAHSMEELAVPDAADKVADVILEVAK